MMLSPKVNDPDVYLSPSRMSGRDDLGGVHHGKLYSPGLGIMAFSNICGLNANLNATHHFLHSKKPTALFLTETQISGKNSLKHLKFPGYELHHNFRLHGGVCVYTKNSVSFTRLCALEDHRKDILWLKLSSKSFKKFICCLYRSPSENNIQDLIGYLNRTVDLLNSEHPSSEIIILGDFNVHNEAWLKSNKTNPEGRAMEAFAISNGLSQLINEPTYFPRTANSSSSILDLFLSTHPQPYTVNVSSPLGNSDHAMVEVEYPIHMEKTEMPPPRTVWHYKSADWEGLRDYFGAFPWSVTCFAKKSAKEAADNITEVIQCAMEAYIPHTYRVSRPNHKSWFSRECNLARKNKIEAHKKFLQNPTPQTNEVDIKARNNYNKTVNEAKDRFNERMRDKVLSCPNGSRAFWTLAKHVNNNFTDSSFPPLTAGDGSLITSSKEKAELFASTFSANSTLNPPANMALPTVPVVPHRLGDIKFKVKRVRKTLQSLNTNKASGLDGIPALLLKKCAPELAPVLTKLFQLSYDSGIFPDGWKSARVQPIPKKGSKTQPSNYRPVALLSVISKVMERIINSEILKYLEHHRLIHDRQYGFRRGRSTADLLSYVTQIWNSALQSYGETSIVALDIAKAFDRVWHAALLNKLPSYGFPTKLCQWISDFLSGRTIQVVVDGHASGLHKINAGVPQGSALAPTLFLIHINDLLSATSNPIHCFADDSTLHSSIAFERPVSVTELNINRVAAAAALSKDLDIITHWGAANLVNFNASKTQTCCLSNKKSANSFPIFMNHQTLNFKDSFRLVGVEISNDLIWHGHVVDLAVSAGKKLGFLFRARKYFSPSNLATLYKAQIRPGLEYCSHVWGAASPTTLALLDSVQNRAIRLVDDPNITNNWAPLSHRRAVADLSLFYRYFHGFCSLELASIMPQLYRPVRETRQTVASHRYTVELRTSRTSRFDRSFVSRTSKLWNALPPDVFPEYPNLQLFKSRVNKLSLSSL